METVDGKVFLLVSQKKWDRGKLVVKKIQDELRLKGCLNHKELECDRGFLGYLSKRHKHMCPYLKGIRQVLDSWCEGRNEDG